MKTVFVAGLLVLASFSLVAPTASAAPPGCPPPDGDPRPCDPEPYCAGMSMPKEAVRCVRELLGV